jgi:hypothetical protein
LADTDPEPSAQAMMLLGFAGLGFAFRQSRRKASAAAGLSRFSGPTNHRALQICFGIAAIDERGADLACVFERSSRPAFE